MVFGMWVLIIKSLQSLSSALQSIRFLEGGGLVKEKKKQVKQVRLVRSLNSLQKFSKWAIGSSVGMRLLRYEARGKIGKHEECVTVPRDGAVSTFNFLRAL